MFRKFTPLKKAYAISLFLGSAVKKAKPIKLTTNNQNTNNYE